MLGWGRPKPPGGRQAPVASGVFSILPESSRDVSAVDKFSVYFALESLFLAFLKFTLQNTEYAKLMEIVRLNPRLVCFHVLLWV